jgi:regulatory protein PHO2
MMPLESQCLALRDPGYRPASSIKGKTDKDNDKEKRKRSRVTPEQLVHLERFFSTDRSPTAARRKEISELLGMQERQTQIWFQNRLDGYSYITANPSQPGSTDEPKPNYKMAKRAVVKVLKTPPDTPPELATGYEVDLHNLIHEDEGRRLHHDALKVF